MKRHLLKNGGERYSAIEFDDVLKVWLTEKLIPYLLLVSFLSPLTRDRRDRFTRCCNEAKRILIIMQLTEDFLVNVFGVCEVPKAFGWAKRTAYTVFGDMQFLRINH